MKMWLKEVLSYECQVAHHKLMVSVARIMAFAVVHHHGNAHAVKAGLAGIVVYAPVHMAMHGRIYQH